MDVYNRERRQAYRRWQIHRQPANHGLSAWFNTMDRKMRLVSIFGKDMGIAAGLLCEHIKYLRKGTLAEKNEQNKVMTFRETWTNPYLMSLMHPRNRISLRRLLWDFIEATERYKDQHTNACELFATELPAAFLKYLEFALTCDTNNIVIPEWSYNSVSAWIAIRTPFLDADLNLRSAFKGLFIHYEDAFLQTNPWHRGRKFPLIALSDRNAERTRRIKEVTDATSASRKKYTTCCKKLVSSGKICDTLPGVPKTGTMYVWAKNTKFSNKLGIFLDLPIEIWRFHIIGYL
ncbi:unnamed protein product [Amoebophrya sp. A120]|nr:unnamed protein product [Amoebophrya sp. A120]|eukprot:GSA120T00001704001.1